MNRQRGSRTGLTAWLIIFLLFGSPAGASQSSGSAGEQELRTLEPGVPIRRELAGGEQQTYQVQLNADQFLKVIVEQDGTDVAVQVSGSDGRKLAEFDSELRPRGPEFVSLVAEAAAGYRLTVRAKLRGVPAGRYEIRIQELRTATENDRVLQQARRLAEEFGRLRDAGKFDPALSLAERALAMREQVPGADLRELAEALDDVATIYYFKGDYAKAEPVFQRALAIREKELGPDHPEVASSLSRIAINCLGRGEYAKAEPMHQRALAIRQQALGADHPAVADSFYNLALLYSNRGEYARAESFYQQSLSIREKVLEPNHPDLADSLNGLAGLYRNRGEYAKAEPLYRRALSIREQILGPDHPGIATSLNNLANLYSDRGEYARAEPLYQRALNILEKMLGPDHPGVATALNNLAAHYRDRGEYPKAEPLYQRALSIREKALGPEHPNLALAFNNLAAVYRDLGDYQKAEPLFRRALAIWEKALGPGHPNVASALNSLATLYRERGEYEQAEPLYRRALSIREKALGPNHPNVAITLNHLATVYLERAEYEQAEALYRRALSIQEQALGPEHPSLATSLNNLATLYGDRGDYQKAEPLYQRALAIREKALGPDHPEVAESLSGLARLGAVQGRLDQAVAFQSRANEVGEHNLELNLAVGSERRKLAYLALYSNQTDFTLTLQARAAAGDQAALDLAFTTLLRRKGRGLDAMTDTIAALRRGAAPADQQLFDQLAATRSQLAALTFGEATTTTPDLYRTRIRSLEETVEKMEADLSVRSAGFRAQTRPVTLSAVQAALPSDGALIEFALFTPRDLGTGRSQPPRYAAFVLPARGRPGRVDLGEAAPIHRAIEEWRKALRGRPDARRLGAEVETMVMQPVMALLGEAGRLLIAPDGLLNLIPFAALVDPEGRYLVERYTISYLTSGRDLLRLQASEPSQTPPLVVANPIFGRAATTRTAGDSPAGDQGQIDSGPLLFRPLPGTQGEALAIKAVMPEASLLLRGAATEAALKQARSPRILHIATHGFFLDEREEPLTEMRGAFGRDSLRISARRLNEWVAHIKDPLLRSGLALSGANLGKSQGDDGVLTALEAAGLDLRGTKLVVLSACETGVGEIQNGEGVQGLRRALVLAGSESQVMSLWPVADQGSKELMIQYYRALQKGAGFSDGLRQVQLKMLKSKTRQHPFYWAAFIQSGDWANLDGRR